MYDMGRPSLDSRATGGCRVVVLDPQQPRAAVVELNRALTEWKKHALKDDAAKVLSDTWHTDPRLVADTEALVEATEAAEAHRDQAPHTYAPRGALTTEVKGDDSWKGFKARPDKEEEEEELKPSKPTKMRTHKDFRGKAVEVAVVVVEPQEQQQPHPFAVHDVDRPFAPSPDEVFSL